MAGRHVSRRRFLIRGTRTGGGLAALAIMSYAGYRWEDSGATPSESTTTASDPTAAANSGGPYVSRPDLAPPIIEITHDAGWTPDPNDDVSFYLVAPKPSIAGVHLQSGLMIVTDRGEPVWFQRSTPGTTQTDLQVQSFGGQSVLTWWEGSSDAGHGRGTGHVVDAAYQSIATIHAGNGLTVDSHELNLTPQGTALITAYGTARADLSSVGGPRNGVVFTCQAQEIDVATGKLLFAWNSIDHVAVAESYKPFSGGTAAQPFDYFHMNSVALTPDGDLLISARNTWAVYKVSRKTGAIVWRLGGKKSNFSMGPGTTFYWQHDARALSATRISLFDDGASPAEEPQSRGLVLQLDTSTMACRLVRAYVHPSRILAVSQGSVQVLADARVVVGWGNEPYFSEFLSDGTMILDARFPTGMQSYRAFRSTWSGRPSTTPDLAVRGGATTRVYCSWNGDTRTTRWRVLAGPNPSSLGAVAVATKSGFETMVTSNSPGPYFTVEALNAIGQTLGTSATVQV